MDILIILITVVAGFALFVGVVFFLSLLIPPKINEHFKTLYKTVSGKVKYPGKPGNPYSFPGKTNNP